jgi:hypothetical protein
VSKEQETTPVAASVLNSRSAVAKDKITSNDEQWAHTNVEGKDSKTLIVCSSPAVKDVKLDVPISTYLKSWKLRANVTHDPCRLPSIGWFGRITDFAGIFYLPKVWLDQGSGFITKPQTLQLSGYLNYLSSAVDESQTIRRNTEIDKMLSLSLGRLVDCPLQIDGVECVVKNAEYIPESNSGENCGHLFHLAIKLTKFSSNIQKVGIVLNLDLQLESSAGVSDEKDSKLFIKPEERGEDDNCIVKVPVEVLLKHLQPCSLRSICIWLLRIRDCALCGGRAEM